MERAFFLLDRGHAFNGVTIVSVRGPVTEDLLRAGLRRLEVPAQLALRRDQARPGDDRQLILTDEGAGPLPLAIVPRKSDATWQEVATNELNLRFADDSDHLVRFVWVAGRTTSEILLVNHHVLLDALSCAFALRDLLTDMALLWRGDTPPPVDSMALRPALPDLLPPAARGLSRLGHMHAFFYKHILGGLFRGTRKMPIEQPAPAQERRTAIVHRALPPAMTGRLAALARGQGTTVHASLCASLLLSAADVAFAAERAAGQALPLGCWSAVSLRGDLVPTLGDELGLYISQVTTFHRVPPSGESDGAALWALAREVKDQLGRTLRWGEQFLTLPMMGMFIPYGKNPGPRFVRRFDGASPATLGVTNISRLPLPSTYGPFVIENVQIVVSPSVVSNLLAAVATWGDTLNLNIVHVEPLVSHARAEAILDGALRYLDAACASSERDAMRAG